jgi:hypothetical protein
MSRARTRLVAITLFGRLDKLMVMRRRGIRDGDSAVAVLLLMILLMGGLCFRTSGTGAAPTRRGESHERRTRESVCGPDCHGEVRAETEVLGGGLA